MVSAIHTLFIDLFTSSPSALFMLAPELPSDDIVALLSEDCTQLQPIEYRADAVLQVGDPPRALIVLEVQRKVDPRKRWTWPMYLAAVSARHELPSTLVVVATDERVARWAMGLLARGNAAELAMVVLSPESIINAASDDDVLRSPELAVALMRCYQLMERKPPDSLGLLAYRSVEIATERLANDDRVFYADLILAALGDALRTELENRMNQRNWEPQTQFFKDLFAREAAAREEGLEQGIERGIEQGRLESLRSAIGAILVARGFTLTALQRATLAACDDVAQLDRWIAQSATADTVEAALALG